MKRVILTLAMAMLIGLAFSQRVETFTNNQNEIVISTAIQKPTENTVDVVVSNFTDVGCVSLTLLYDNTEIAIESINFPLTGGIAWDWGYKIRLGYLAMDASQVITLPSGTVLFSVSFTKLTGFTGIPQFGWDASGGNCEYASYGGEVIYKAVFY